MSLITFVVLMVFAMASANLDWTVCKSPCVCKWSSGKKNAICKLGGLTSIPDTLESEIQILDLSQNHIKRLGKDAFKPIGLFDLQKIFLSRNDINELDKDSFRGLDLLFEIDLSHNALTELHPQTFQGNERLRVLLLSGNPLKKLMEKQFPPLPHLRILDLEGCQIENIHKDAFVYVGALETLNLKNNSLKNVLETTFMNLTRLRNLSLDGNPWRCDCELRKLGNWVLANHFESTSLTCSEPDLLNKKQWREVNFKDFSCPPQVVISPKNELNVEAGGNVTIG